MTSPLFDYVSATHGDAYQQGDYDPGRTYTPPKWVGPVDRSVTHTRHGPFLKPDYALLLDTLGGTGTHTFDAHFHLDAPAARIDADGQAAFTSDAGDVGRGLFPLDRASLTADVVRGQKGPMLGWWPARKRAIPTVRFRKTQAAPATFATFLYPYRGAPDGLWTRTIDTATERVDVAVRRQASPAPWPLALNGIGPVTADAEGLAVRRAKPNGPPRLGGWGVRAYRDPACAFGPDVPASLTWQTRGDTLDMCNAGPGPATVRITTPFIRAVTLAPGVRTRVSATGVSATGVVALPPGPPQ